MPLTVLSTQPSASTPLDRRLVREVIFLTFNQHTLQVM